MEHRTSEHKVIKVCQTCAWTCEADEAPASCPYDGGMLRERVDDSLIGQVIAGRYELLSFLGSGGHGYVYKARHLLIARQFAVKFLHRRFADNPSMVTRFQQEAKAASVLCHPNLIGVYDFGIAEGGLSYMAMDYVEGTSLAEIIRSRWPLDLEETLTIFKQVCEGLAWAHQRGVIHRDLKPSNIVIIESPSLDPVVKVVDFGLAKLLDEYTAGQENLNLKSKAFGSPLYMSPEQCRETKVDARSDIYSLGCVMYETLAGRPPVAGTNPIALINAHLNVQPRPFAEVCSDQRIPASFEALVLKCLSKDRGDRFSSMAELRKALDAVSPSDSRPSPNRDARASVTTSEGNSTESGKSLSPPAGAKLAQSFKRGLEWTMEKWLDCGGETVRVSDHPWLVGPQGLTQFDLSDSEQLADVSQTIVGRSGVTAGLVNDFSCFDGGGFSTEAVDPLVKDFYLKTGRHQIEAWSQWTGILKPAIVAIVTNISRSIDQLHLPVSPIEISQGIKSEVTAFCDKNEGRQQFASWIRSSRSTGHVIVAGLYLPVSLPGHARRCLKVVLPLPKGCCTVIMSPQNDPEGGITWAATGNKFGQPACYRIRYLDDDRLKVMVGPFTQTIHTFVDGQRTLRQQQSLRVYGMKSIDFYYKLTRS